MAINMGIKTLPTTRYFLIEKIFLFPSVAYNFCFLICQLSEICILNYLESLKLISYFFLSLFSNSGVERMAFGMLICKVGGFDFFF